MLSGFGLNLACWVNVGKEERPDSTRLLCVGLFLRLQTQLGRAAALSRSPLLTLCDGFNDHADVYQDHRMPDVVRG